MGNKTTISNLSVQQPNYHPLGAVDDPMNCCPRPSASGNSSSGHPQHLGGDCYEMDKTSISMFEILEPGGQLWANTAFEGSQFYSIGVPKFYSWVNVISVYAYNDLG